MAVKKCKSCNQEISKNTKFCGNCGTKIDNKNIGVFFVKMLLIFIGVNLIITIIPSFLSLSIENFKYGNDFIVESIFAILVLIVMLISKNSYVFTEKKEKFWKSILLGLPILLIAVACLISNIVTLESFNFGNAFNLILFCFSIGLAEELLCRGWIQNEFIERFGSSRKQVIMSIILSSLVFGFMHLTNALAGQSLFQTIIQVLQTTALGALLGTIYYRTKNIWSVIFLHAFYDFSILLGSHSLIKDCTTNGTINNNIILYQLFSTIVIMLFYIVSVILLTRKSKLNKLIDNNYQISNIEETKEKKTSKFLWICLIALATTFGFTGMIEDNIKGIEEYYICYDYKELEIKEYDTHYPYYDKFYINHTNKLTNEKYNYEIFYDENNFLLGIKNTISNEIIHLDYLYVVEYEVIENENTFTIVVHDNNGIESTIYYNIIDKTKLTNDKDYLNNIKENFNSYKLPIIDQIGYLTTNETDYNYPLMFSSLYEKFIIDENGDLYLIKE